MTPLKVRTALDHRSVKKASGDLVATGVSITSRSSKNLLKKVLHCFLFSSLALFLQPLTANAQPGIFSATGSMTTAQADHTATLLSNGEVLLAGGCNSDCTYVALSSADLYNPATGTFTATGLMASGRGNTSLTLLPNGQLLVAGGNSSSGALASAELYTITPPLQVSPASLSFAKQALGSTSSVKKVTITNKTGLAVTLGSWALTGTNSADFNVAASTCGGVLSVKASCTVSVAFAPQQTGVRSAALTITDSSSNSPQSVSLAGTGILPVSVTPSSLKFPAAKVGTTSSAKLVTITNHLPGTLAISSISPTGTNAGDFAVQTTTCGSALTAGSSCSVLVTFTPTATGSRVATLTISDGAITSPQNVAMSGTGK